MLKQETLTENKSQAVPTPTVSVIIPAYNVAAYIAETLDSVFDQTFPDYEVIIVNDGSPDTEALEAVLAPYLARIIYLKQENRGAGAARNEGLRSARGEFVAFLDADDLWLPTYLAEQIEFIRGGAYDLIYADALLFGDSPFAGRTFMKIAPSEGEVNFQNLITGKCNVITSGVVARRDLILEAGLFDEELWNSQDFELWVRLVRLGARANYQRKVLLRYRYHGDSLSGSPLNQIRRELEALGKIESTYDLGPVEHNEVSEMMKAVTASLELETGKLHLSKGEFPEARRAFLKAKGARSGFKLGATLLGLKLAPGLLQRMYVRRVSRISRRNSG